MKKKSMTKNHGGKIIGGAVVDKRQLRRSHWKENHREEIIEERGIWEVSGSYSGDIWEASETPGGLGASRGSKPQESMPISAIMQKCYCNVGFTLCLWWSDHQVL